MQKFINMNLVSNSIMPRLLDRKFVLLALSMVVSANIAFFLYSYFHLNQGYWAVVTIAAVASVELANTFSRMWARLVGTILGAFYAFIAAHYFIHNITLFCIFLSIGVFIFSLAALQRNTLSYGGIIANVTMLLVLGASIDQGNYSTMARERVIQVAIGIIILAIVGKLLHYWFVKEQLPKRLALQRLYQIWNDFKELNLNKHVLLTALRVVIAMVITVLPWLIFRYPGGFWAPVSCFFIIEDSIDKTKQKGKYRFLAHFAVGLYGLIAVSLLGNHPDLLFIPLSIGLIMCCYVLASGQSYSPSGNTMAIALSVMMLADPTSTQIVIYERFVNVMLGIIVGFAVVRFINFDKLPLAKPPAKLAQG